MEKINLLFPQRLTLHIAKDLIQNELNKMSSNDSLYSEYKKALEDVIRQDAFQSVFEIGVNEFSSNDFSKVFH